MFVIISTPAFFDALFFRFLKEDGGYVPFGNNVLPAFSLPLSSIIHCSSECNL